MAEFPALPVFTDAYLADTRHLTTEEHGAYLLLLMCAWRTRGCRLRDDDRLLARIAGVGLARWRRLKPVLIDFFTIEQGYWQQKKLSYVYATVAKKVARNRASGAKGGRATAAKKKTEEARFETLEQNDQNACFSPGWPVATTSITTQVSPPSPVKTRTSSMSVKIRTPAKSPASAQASAIATKAKAKTKNQSNSQPMQARRRDEHPVAENWIARIAAAAGLEVHGIDRAVVDGWRAAGAELEADIVPTVQRLASREMARSGKLPRTLAYYQQAILEVRDKRLKAVKHGQAYADARPPTPQPVVFDKQSPKHWRAFLGDPENRFKGDYLSQNWYVPSGHPRFLPTPLGPDPRQGNNPTIPAEIYRIYGAGWGWRT